jgi:predicted DNA-binding protein (UPF0251 family)
MLGEKPGAIYYKPAGIRLVDLEEVILELDEFEAVRLADLEELYQEEAAAKMNISRATFGRIIMSAHKKIADALINGKAVRIDAGDKINYDANKKRGNSNEDCGSHKGKYCR